MLAGICVGGWDRGVGEVVVFSMGTRLLTAAEKKHTLRCGSEQTLESREGKSNVRQTAATKALTCHDVIQRVCERLCRCSYHEPIWGLLRYHSWTQPGQLLTLLLLAQHLLPYQYPLQLRAGALRVLCGVVVGEGLDGDEGGREWRRRRLGLGLWRRGERRLLWWLWPVPVEDRSHLRKLGVIFLFYICFRLRAFLVIIFLFLKMW